MILAKRLRHAFSDQRGGTEARHPRDDDMLPDPDTLLVPAAVLVAVTDRCEPGLLLTQRTAHLRRHAGQVAFPGGRIDPEDDGPIAAALREAHEEVGLHRGHVEIITATEQYPTGTGFSITPVIAVVPPDLELIPHADEVAAIFEVPLAHVLDAANHARQTAVWQGRQRIYYEIMWEEYRIWGATAGMIISLADRLRAAL